MQTARGASLSDEQTARGTHSARRALTWFAGSAVVAYLVDQGSKSWALRALVDNDVPLIGDLLTLHLTRNPGAAFSLGTEFTVLLTCVAITAVVVILVLARRVKSLFWGFGLGILLGGVAGNLTDRLLRDPAPFRGHVIDFLQLPNWPIFNVADICINVAAGVIVVQTLRGVRLDGTREEAASET